MNKRRIARLFLIPALAGAVAAALVYVYVEPAPVAVPVATVPVVVARKAIPAYTKLTPDMLTVRQVARELSLPGALGSVADAAGKVTVIPLAEGEPVLKAAFEPARAAGSLAAQIPAGRRALTLAVNEVSGVAGRLEVGDRVDAIAVFDKSVTGIDQATLLVENLTVLALGKGLPGGSQSAAKAANPGYTSVTLAVTPQQAVLLSLATKRGQLQLALRPASGDGDVGRIIVTDAALK